MIKMCLYLVGSKYQSIEEVEQLLNCTDLKLTEKDIINMKDNREEIDKQLEIMDSYEYLEEMGL